jgi:hypothetical protein
MPYVYSIGYTCVCGQKVEVLQLRGGDTNKIPQTTTVTCPNGHAATFDARQIGLLEWWGDQPNDPSATSPEGSHSEFKKPA